MKFLHLLCVLPTRRFLSFPALLYGTDFSCFLPVSPVRFLLRPPRSWELPSVLHVLAGLSLCRRAADRCVPVL